MAIIRKDLVAPFLKELDEFHGRLREAAAGVDAPASLAHRFGYEPEQFAREFADVDLEALDRAIGYFKVSVESLRQLKKKASKPLHRA